MPALPPALASVPAPALDARDRHAGLDTLRAAAIGLVFVYHYMVFVSHAPTFGVLSEVGWVGVDLFFVLSGYLIGKQLFAGMARGEPVALGRFYARRALRTWPAFWAVLAAYFLLPGALGGKEPPPLWRFLTFTQNWGLRPGTAFSHAWSLCIEEQFYFVLPLVVGVAWALRRRGLARPWQAWALMGGLLVGGVGLRALLWQAYGLESTGRLQGYYPHVYYSTLCRFDEFLPGLALALLQSAHPGLWARVRARGQEVLLAGLVATLAVLWGVDRFYYVEGVGYGFFMTAFGYSLVAGAFGLLVLAALCPGSWLARARVPGAKTLALWSYSIYLTHKAVGFVVAGYGAARGWEPGAVLGVVVLLSVAVGAALYYAVETPFLRVRERYAPRALRPRPKPGAPGGAVGAVFAARR